MENKHEKKVWNDKQLQGRSSHARSFTCAFCKKGFSNAQALGGHMNIHRKVRAKLKQDASDDDLLSLDITKATSTNPIEQQQQQQQQQSQVISEIDKNLCLPGHKTRKLSKDTTDQGVQQLSLFVEMPSSSDRDMKEISGCTNSGNEEMLTTKRLSEEELDLELRLAGPDPRT